MSTTVEEVRVADVEFAYRWWALMHQEHPALPEALAQLFFDAGGVAPPVEALVDAFQCAEEEAAPWVDWLEAHLIPPAHYGPLFDAEDVLAARRAQWQHYQEDVSATAARLTELQKEIEGTLAYMHLGEAQQAEMKGKLEALDTERVDVLRHQGDLPGVGALIEPALAEARAQLDAAQQDLSGAYTAHVQQVEAQWLQEGLALLEPVQGLLARARLLDGAWQRLGEQPSRERGSGHLLEALLQALRQVLAPPGQAGGELWVPPVSRSF